MEKIRERTKLEGEVPSPINPPAGCRFRTRCKFAMDICEQIQPDLVEVKPNHFVACHLCTQKNENQLLHDRGENEC